MEQWGWQIRKKRGRGRTLHERDACCTRLQSRRSVIREKDERRAQAERERHSCFNTFTKLSGTYRAPHRQETCGSEVHIVGAIFLRDQEGSSDISQLRCIRLTARRVPHTSHHQPECAPGKLTVWASNNPSEDVKCNLIPVSKAKAERAKEKVLAP